MLDAFEKFKSPVSSELLGSAEVAHFYLSEDSTLTLLDGDVEAHAF